MTPISLQMVGMEHLSSAHGLERFFCGLGYFAGPPIAGQSKHTSLDIYKTLNIHVLDSNNTSSCDID